MTEIELHARKKQSQELNQLDVLEHESFCAWTLWLSLWEWAWVWVGLGTELVESFIKEIYKEFPRLPTLAFKRRPFYPTLTEAWSSGETEQALTWGIRHSRVGGTIPCMWGVNEIYVLKETSLPLPVTWLENIVDLAHHLQAGDFLRLLTIPREKIHRYCH